MLTRYIRGYKSYGYLTNFLSGNTSDLVGYEFNLIPNAIDSSDRCRDQDVLTIFTNDTVSKTARFYPF